MGKLKSFVIGSLLGAGGMYVGLQYHVLQADEGFLIVARSPQQRIQDAYADVRDWDAATWSARPRLALAVTEQGRGDLIAEGVSTGLIDTLRESFASPSRTQQEVSSGWEPASTTGTPAPQRGRSAAKPTSPARRGFLPLAELFGLGKSEQTPPPAADDSSIAPILPANDSKPKVVELLPTPKEFELLDGPHEVELGPSAPFPGSLPGVDRRRSDARDTWEPLSVQAF